MQWTEEGRWNDRLALNNSSQELDDQECDIYFIGIPEFLISFFVSLSWIASACVE